MGNILKSIGIIVIGMLLVVFNCFILSTLWGWFITPDFGLKVPSYPVLYGLMLIIAFVGPTSNEESYKKAIFTGLAKSIIILSFGWIVHAIFL